MKLVVLSAVLLMLICATENAYIVNSVEEAGKKWAVLVAGSNGWGNYRHQADICHAYQIFRNNDIPEENIVLMMYDDIAYNPQNIYKGKVFNHPNGTDVYGGVVKDYTGEDVNPQNFLAVLQGQKFNVSDRGSGKVVDSGPYDTIFINLVDHGGPGAFCFPNSILHARDFVNVIISMHRNNRFKEMVIYLESCESGSMFLDLLPDDLNVYAMTASSPFDSSYACYFDFALNNFLGDCFSVGWMEDTDIENLGKETLDQQFYIVHNEVKDKENASRYGDLKMEKEVLSTFLGTHKNQIKKKTSNKQLHNNPKTTAVPSPDVPIRIIEEKLKRVQATDKISTHKQELLQLLKKRNFLEGKIKEIVLSATWNWDLTMQIVAEKVTEIYNWDCYEESVDYFHANCFNLGQNSYALRYLKVFSKLCSRGYSAKELMQAMSEVCNHPATSNII